MDLVPCLVDGDVDTYGFLFGGVDSTPSASEVWDALEVEWEPGSTGRQPNIFCHNFIRDFLFDDVALRSLRSIAGDDLKVNGTLRLGQQILTVVEAAPVLSVVDEARSRPSEFSWAKIGFPHVETDLRESVSDRMFHLPYPELSTSVVVGAKVREAYERAGLTGWVFEPAAVDD